MLTVAPFDVDVDAHLDAAEDLVLCHSHLHNDGCTGTQFLLMNVSFSRPRPATWVTCNAVKGVLRLPCLFSQSAVVTTVLL